MLFIQAMVSWLKMQNWLSVAKKKDSFSLDHMLNI